MTLADSQYISRKMGVELSRRKDMQARVFGALSLTSLTVV